MRDWYEILGVLILICVAAGFSWKVLLRRKWQFEKIFRTIKPLGLTHVSDGLETLPPTLKAHPFMPQLDVFGMLAVWKGKIDELETYIVWKGTRNIDSYESVALGERYMGMMVGCIRADPPCLPECKIVPEFSFFGHVKREQAFNDSYSFEPSDDVIRDLFSCADVKRLFEKEKGWFFHNSSEWAVVYKYSEKDVDSEVIGEFMKGAFRVFRVLDNKWKEMASASLRR